MIAALQEPDIAGDLKNAYDGIRSAGKTIAEVRAMAVSDAAREPARDGDMSCEVSLPNWDARAGPRSSDWSARNSVAGPANWSERMTFRIRPRFQAEHARIPQGHRPALKEFGETVRAWAVDRHTAPFRAMIFDVLTRFEELYNERKLAAGNLDFNDLERHTIDLLRQTKRFAIASARSSVRSCSMSSRTSTNSRRS